MRITPSTSSLFLATLAISSSSSSLAAPTGDGPTSVEVGLVASGSITDGLLMMRDFDMGGRDMERRDLVSLLTPITSLLSGLPIVGDVLKGLCAPNSAVAPALGLIHSLLGVDLCAGLQSANAASILSAIPAPAKDLSAQELAQLQTAVNTVAQALGQTANGASVAAAGLTANAGVSLPSSPLGLIARADADADAAAAPAAPPNTSTLPARPALPVSPAVPSNSSSPSPSAAAAAAPSPPVSPPVSKVPAPIPSAVKPPVSPPSPPVSPSPESKEPAARRSRIPMPPPMRRTKASMGWTFGHHHRRQSAGVLENAPPLFDGVPVTAKADFALED